MARQWVTIEQYFGPYHANYATETPEKIANARVLLKRVNSALDMYSVSGGVMSFNPHNRTSFISGHGNGGFRPADCKVGAPRSKHKSASAIDLFDPDGRIKEFFTEAMLTQFDLYMELPRATPTWAHLQTLPPASKRRIFLP
jgi:hypothetical protein